MSRQQDRSRRVARYVAARRDSLGLSQEALADRAGLNPKTISTLEAGKHWPVAKTRRALEPALGWDEGDFEKIADGGFPATGPLPVDDPDGLIAAAMASAESEGDDADFEARVRAVIGDLPERYRPFVEELYEQWQEAERRNRRLMDKIVPLPTRDDAVGDEVPEPPDNDGALGSG